MLNITALIIAITGGIPLGLLIDSTIKKNITIRKHYEEKSSKKNNNDMDMEDKKC